MTHSEDHYVVIYCSEEGDVRMEVLNRAALIDRLDGKYWGETRTLTPERLGAFVDLRARPGITIIKGSIVAPKPKTTVQTWDIE